MSSDGGQPEWQMSALNRAASSLKLQLSSVQLQLQAFANALIYNPPASIEPIHQHLRPMATSAPQPPATTFSASSSAGSTDDLSARGYTIHAPDAMAAIGLTAAERYATARAVVANRLRAHTFHPASTKVTSHCIIPASCCLWIHVHCCRSSPFCIWIAESRRRFVFMLLQPRLIRLIMTCRRASARQY